MSEMHSPEWFTIDTGSTTWWRQQQQQGLPRIERINAQSCRVTFLWRQPTSQTSTQPIQAVWLNITGITDHHQPNPPTSLIHYPETDVWYLQLILPADWRGSYCFIPDTVLPAVVENQDIFTRREWWRQQFHRAQHDPLNSLRAWSAGRGMPVSPLHMPDAPAQPEWDGVDYGKQFFTAPHHFTWQSQRLGNQRRVWWYRTGELTHEHTRLAILLDGQFWAQTMPICGPLQQLTAEGKLPPAIYVMPDIIDREHRGQELPCNPEFWQAIRDELLPQIKKECHWQHDATQTIVAGQSFGGLASVYAVLNWPETFGNALSLSGSFWWPNRGQAAGALIEQLQKTSPPVGKRKIFLKAGCREKVICEANREMQHWLTHYHIPHSLTLVEGGHDALWWRGSLLNGLQTLWQDEYNDSY